eukprot:g7577.t1
MSARKTIPFPITRTKAIDYFTALVGDEDKAFFATADNYVSTTIARLKCIDGAFDMSTEDEAAVRAVVGRQRRAGKFEHEQAPAYGVADKDKNEFQTFAGDFKYNPKSQIFMLDMRGHVLKSNAIKQVFVSCLCEKEGLESLCPHQCIPTIANDTEWKEEFIACISELFGHTRTHCMRVGCLQQLMSCSITRERISCHLRWQGDNMQKFYNRSNSYKLNKYKGFSFIP